MFWCEVLLSEHDTVKNKIIDKKQQSFFMVIPFMSNLLLNKYNAI